MNVEDVDAYLRRLDELFDGEIEAELYDEEFEEEWPDLVAAIEWAATAKAAARGSVTLDVGDVLWGLSALGLFPKMTNETWQVFDASGGMDRSHEDPDRYAARRVRAELFRGRSQGARVPAFIPSHQFDFADLSILGFLVPHPDAPNVLVSIDELYLDLEELDRVVDYLGSLDPR